MIKRVIYSIKNAMPAKRKGLNIEPLSLYGHSLYYSYCIPVDVETKVEKSKRLLGNLQLLFAHQAMILSCPIYKLNLKSIKIEKCDTSQCCVLDYINR